MSASNIIPAIWVHFTPYLVDWTEEEYGTALTLCGRHVLELRQLQGIRQIMREAVDDDCELAIDNGKSLSQLRYEVTTSVLDARLDNDKILARYTKDNIKSFLPVLTPRFMQVEGGTVRQFSRTMQLRKRMAHQIAQKVYNSFWQTVHQYAQSASFAIDRDMLESFCEENNIPSIHVDDLRNQYQRLKRQGFYLNES